MKHVLFWCVFILILIPMCGVAVSYPIFDAFGCVRVTNKFDRWVSMLELFQLWCES